MSLSTWNSHSPCGRYFLNLPQGGCAIQVELPNFYCNTGWWYILSLLYLYPQILKIHRTLPPGGILVFVTGQGEVSALCRKLRALFSLGKKPKKNWEKEKQDEGEEEDGDGSQTDEQEKMKAFKKIKLPKINLDRWVLII